MHKSLALFIGSAVLLVSPLVAQDSTQHEVSGATPMSEAQKQTLIREATAAAPAPIAANASVVAPGPGGQMMELRHGTNGWTCLPDAPDSPGKDPMCLDAEGMKWASSWMNHEPKPASTAPGLAYMLQGGSDISDRDPWAKPDPNTKFVTSPPHIMILWPYDPQTSGLSDTPKQTGTWIMWSGTPYAHLMVNGTP
jgi:hypothetical protein